MLRKLIISIIVLTIGISVNGQQKKIKTHTGHEQLTETSPHARIKTRIVRKEQTIRKNNRELTAKTFSNSSKSTLWDVQFGHNVEIGSGVETNGYYNYVSQWNNDTIYVYNMNGTPFGKNKISVTGIRDMAFDGTYFYGSNASNVIYKMDFTNFVVIDSIVCPAYVSVRHIAFDSNNSGFWVGDWDSDIYLVNNSGQVINTLSATNHNLYGMYGSAYDNFTTGGPYLWLFDQGGMSGCDIVMLQISTGKVTGIIHNCTEDVASDLMDPIAGGLFIKQNLISGTVTLGGLVQRQRIFGYNLATLVANNDVGVEDVLSPILQTGCTLGSNETISIKLRNYGLNSASNITAHMNLNGQNYSFNVPGTLNRFETYDVTFQGTYNFSQPNAYKMKFYTTYNSDLNNSNDTGFYTVITGNGLASVDVFTDDYPDETYWEFYNNFTYDLYGTSWVMDAATLNSTEMCVDTTKCYGFTIYDAYGDGILAPGYYEIFFDGNSVLMDDDFTGLFEEVPYIGHCDYADVGVAGVLAPVSACLLGTEEMVSVLVKNYGTQPAANPDVVLEINGNIYSEPLGDTLNSQEETTFYFSNLQDLSGYGIYNMKLYTTLSGDMNVYNDTSIYTVENYFPSSMPYQVNFEDDVVNEKLLVEDENMDYFSWALYNTGGVTNSSCAVYAFNPNEPANDWLYSKCIEFLTGNQYTLSFYTKAQSSGYPEKLKVHICQAPSAAAAFTQPLINLGQITDTTYTLNTVSFNVDDIGSGYYYLGFNVYSDLGAWNLYLDNISVTGPAGIQNPATEDLFNIYPNPAHNTLTVDRISPYNTKGTYSITLTDMQGRVLLNDMLDSFSKNLNISALSDGMYFIRIGNEVNSYFSKFIKK